MAYIITISDIKTPLILAVYEARAAPRLYILPLAERRKPPF